MTDPYDDDEDEWSCLPLDDDDVKSMTWELEVEEEFVADSMTQFSFRNMNDLTDEIWLIVREDSVIKITFPNFGPIMWMSHVLTKTQTTYLQRA